MTLFTFLLSFLPSQATPMDIDTPPGEGFQGIEPARAESLGESPSEGDGRGRTGTPLPLETNPLAVLEESGTPGSFQKEDLIPQPRKTGYLHQDDLDGSVSSNGSAASTVLLPQFQQHATDIEDSVEPTIAEECPSEEPPAKDVEAAGVSGLRRHNAETNLEANNDPEAFKYSLKKLEATQSTAEKVEGWMVAGPTKKRHRSQSVDAIEGGREDVQANLGGMEKVDRPVKRLKRRHSLGAIVGSGSGSLVADA